MDKWYEQIDLRIRELIYELRNNGINTTCSNGDKGYIEAEWHENVDPIIVYELCRQAGYKLVRVESIWTTFPVPQKYIKIRLYDKKFGNIPETYIPKMYTQIVEPNSPKQEVEVELHSSTDDDNFLSLADKACLYHRKIIRFLQPLFPKFIFISQFDRRIAKTEMPKMPKSEGKEMIYVLNYNLGQNAGFESTIRGYTKQIDFYRLTVEETQKQAELFRKLGILIGEEDERKISRTSKEIR